MLQLENVSKRYGRKQVLNDISFKAKKGEITCLIGVNGTGKTTIMNAIMNLIPINSGKITLDGKEKPQDFYNHISYIPDEIIVNKAYSVRQAMDYMADFYAVWNEEKAQELLTFFRLEEDAKINSLSKGNVAKVNLLLGLALDVDFVLMDEPFSGIDVFTREQIAAVFTSSLVEDKGVLITTHEINDIEYLVDKAVLLDEGKVIKEFYPEEVREMEGKSIVDVMREVYLP
ncbi:ABC-2 type transport system ATP-binding protein [Granulicatella balaenopterae]|uniref:ABC-2 type transport system ATP-binding protein n=1 Tax=Granulicatella balaenopterae TaxID=137733 RepID=A0A1H9MHX7_9LACT|nr:ABC transporter ATP-binding protein [Granulicatella balaenopterae]SER23141.1 ABC-2 type transport system ATP-binding protein [Granulicatella balaenopterae]